MCFSAEASFGASAVILTISAVCLKKSVNFPQRMLSCIPVIFGVQQFAEGIVWLSLKHPGLAALEKVASYTFLIFAQVVWPIFLPLCIYLMEPDAKRKKILRLFLGLGCIVASVLAITLALYDVQSTISCSHIRYNVAYPFHLRHLGIFYFLATVPPSIISGVKRLRLSGIAIFVGYVVTRIFYQDYLISVWCFFAAITSVIILSVIIDVNKPGNLLIIKEA
jgi:hypothetical protein